MIACHARDFTWNRGCISNSPLLFLGIKFPTHWKTLIIKFPFPRNGKGVKCPGYAQGGCWSFDLSDTLSSATRGGKCHLRSGVIFFFFFFASLLLWREREKNKTWYIYLTSHQPPPNLHNLTSAWPVMLLANKRLPYGNQILARIMSLLKSILGKRKFLSTSMFRWRFLKRILNVFKYC